MQNTVSFIIARTSRIIIFGCVYLLFSSLLLLYFYSRPPVKVEDFHYTKINYQRVYFKESPGNVVLVSDAKEYLLSLAVLNYNQEKTDPEELLKKLSLTSKAEVWLESSVKGTFIMGIKTDNFYFSPEKGAAIASEGAKGFVDLFSWFTIGGAVIIILGVLNFLLDNAKKRNLTL